MAIWLHLIPIFHPIEIQFCKFLSICIFFLYQGHTYLSRYQTYSTSNEEYQYFENEKVMCSLKLISPFCALRTYIILKINKHLSHLLYVLFIEEFTNSLVMNSSNSLLCFIYFRICHFRDLIGNLSATKPRIYNF